MKVQGAKPLISVKNLHKIYDNGMHALRDVSFDVHAGEFLVVIGLSGSGKSTLLRCLNRLIEPTSGEIFYADQDVSHIKGRDLRTLRKSVAMIFQHFNLVRRHTVLSNTLMGRLSFTSTLKSLLGLFRIEDKQMALKYLNLVGLSGKIRARADTLSGGEQQRVAIAKALMQEPKILLADEPVASLDPSSAHNILDYLEKINKELGITVICNLHFLSLVRRYATRVIALKSGQMVYDGPPNGIDKQWFHKIYGESAKEVHID